MKHYKTEGVILDTTDIFDADRSLLLFSAEYGKIRARAKGVRKPTSRLTGHLLSYVPTQMELVEGSGGFIVTQAQIQGRITAQTYPENPLIYVVQAGIIAEALNRLYVEGEPHPSVYDGLVYTLDRILELCREDGPEENIRLVAAEFLLKALAELGYRPELQQCVVSGEALNPEWIGWSDSLGGVVSEDGYRQMQSGGVERLQFSKTVVALRQFLKPEFYAERLQMPEEVAKEVRQVIYGYLQYQIGQPLKSLR